MSISIEWSAQGDKWLLRRGGEGALCRIGGHCSHHAHRTQYIHKHTTLTYFHNFSFLYFSYIFIFFHTFPYHGGHCSHHMHCTQYIHKHTTITFFNDVLAGPGRSYILQKLCPNVDISLHNALCSKGWHFWKGGFVTNKTGLKISVFINAMIFAFTTFVTNTPLYGKIASKVWKIYFQIYHLIFCMLQAAKYLIYDYFYFLILLFFLP